MAGAVSGPRIIAGSDADEFRIVRVEAGERLTYVMEMPDGCDALGVERWRHVSVNGKPFTALFSYVIKQANKAEQGE